MNKLATEENICQCHLYYVGAEHCLSLNLGWMNEGE